MLIQPIQEYFDCLFIFATKKYDCVDDSTNINLTKVKALIEQNLLYGDNSTTSLGVRFTNVSITPRGAVVLAEWSSLIESKSLKGQFMATIGRIIWIIVGMVFTVCGALILKIMQ